MAVPAHDERDHEFAEKFGIEIKRVIANPNRDETESKLPYSGPGVMVNSGEYDGMDADACKSKIITDLEAKDAGKGAVNYKFVIGFSLVSDIGESQYHWFGYLPRIMKLQSKLREQLKI